MPTEMVESPPLEVFKKQLDMTFSASSVDMVEIGQRLDSIWEGFPKLDEYLIVCGLTDLTEVSSIQAQRKLH